MDYIPQVSQEDVLRIIRREFPYRNPARILRLLYRYEPEANRVYAAIPKLSCGNFESLKRYSDMAEYDFRDAILFAEYPEFSKVGFVGVEKMSKDEVQRLKDDDWKQYQDWFMKE